MARCPHNGRQLTRTFNISHSEGIDPLPADAQTALLTIATQVERVHTLPTEVQLVIVNDEHMGQLNSTYRNKEGTTDVLAFDLGSTPGQPSSGEIYISLPQAKQQAISLTVPLLEELARLSVHGLLHLAGWVHDTPAQLRAMERETEVFLDAIDLNLPI